MAITLNQIYKEVDEKKLSPIYLITGEEPYYIDLISDKFEKNLIEESNIDFNQNILYGEDTSASEIIGICRQYPLMSDLRLVMIKEAQLLSKNEWTKLHLYLSKPLSSTILVICNKNKTFDIKTKNLIVKNGGVVFESKKIADYKLNDWIIAYAKEQGYSINEQAANLINEYLGNNLQTIDNEFQKLIINLKGKKNINEDDIKSFIGISKDYNIFELEKALIIKDVVKANKIIDYFDKNPKENPIQLIIPMLFNYFVKILIASQTPSHSQQEIASNLGYNSPFFAKDFTTAIQYYSTPQLLSIINIFEEYDMKTKGVNVSPLTTNGDLLKELIYNIIHI
jgi:DNA polymerase-3 subunit delta